jgi:hypothetical protein
MLSLVEASIEVERSGFLPWIWYLSEMATARAGAYLLADHRNSGVVDGILAHDVQEPVVLFRGGPDRFPPIRHVEEEVVDLVSLSIKSFGPSNYSRR